MEAHRERADNESYEEGLCVTHRVHFFLPHRVQLLLRIDIGSDGPPIRLFYRNNHYSSIMLDGVGDLFDFEGLKPGEIEQHLVTSTEIRKSKEYQKRIQSYKNLSLLDPNMDKELKSHLQSKKRITLSCDFTLQD